MNSHSKLPTELLYLEMGDLPLSYVFRARRLIYLQTLLKKYESDLIRRIYVHQKAIQIPGDWGQSMAKDFSKYRKPYVGQEGLNMSEHDY